MKNLRPTTKPAPPDPAAQTDRDSGSLVQRGVGTSGLRYSFFMRDGTIHEIEATNAEAALEKLGGKLGKPKWLYRYWLLQEIETCLAPARCPNEKLSHGGDNKL